MKSYRPITAVFTVLLAFFMSSVPASSATVLSSYDHGWAFSQSNKNSPYGVAIENDTVFSYEYISDGKASPLNKYREDWKSWTKDNNAPAVAAWYISATTGIDGAVVFTAPKDMSLSIESTVKIEIDSYNKDKCDGVGIMVLQQNGSIFAPLWPKEGVFSWYDAKSSGATELGSVETSVKKGERILFVVHSIGTPVGDNINVAPKITELSTTAVYPRNFIVWQKENTAAAATQPVSESYVSSWYIGNDDFKNNPAKNCPFVYSYGSLGNYNPMNNKTKYDWGNIWHSDDTVSPWISGFFISASKTNDGVICFTAPESGEYTVENSIDKSISLDTSGGNESDGASFVIITQNEAGDFCPVYPELNCWKWLNVEKSEKYGFNPLTISLKKNEKLLFIVHNRGSETNDTVSFDPRITLKSKGSMSKYPTGFQSWPSEFSLPDVNSNPSRLAELFNDKSVTAGPLSLMYGYDGEYQKLTYYREDWKAWTFGGGAPSIGAGFMGAMAKRDAVLMYTAPENGLITLDCGGKVALDWPDQSDGVSMIIVVSNENGERPIWPKDGEWDYQRITKETPAELGKVSAFLKKGDQMHLIIRSVGADAYDSVSINPSFYIDTSVKDGIIPSAVERVYPTEDDYIKNLIDTGGKLDSPANSEKSALDGIVTVLAIVAVIFLIAGTITVLIVIKKRKRRKDQ